MAMDIELARAPRARSSFRLARLMRRARKVGGRAGSSARDAARGFFYDAERRAFERELEHRRFESNRDGGWL